MNEIYILFLEDELSDRRDVVGWFADREHAERTALLMEWVEYEEQKKAPNKSFRLLSPDETDYRRFTVEPAPRIG